MAEAMKYQLKGTRRHMGDGRVQTFETVIVANGYDDAQTLARDNWRGTWDSVHFTRVTQVR